MAVADHMDWARARVQRALTQQSGDRVVAMLVGSVDFIAAVDGRTAALSAEADRALMRAWREVADALLVGTRTLTAELYAGSIVPADSRRGRAMRDQQPVPPIITIDRSGTLNLDLALRGADPPPLIVYVGEGGARGDARATWVELPELSVSQVLRHARERFDAHVVVAEGGPRLIQAAFDEHLLTDLSLTLAPLLLGSGPRLWEPHEGHQSLLRLLMSDAIDSHVFVHYLIAHPLE